MCPLGVDQTGRMPQTWQILAPRIEKIKEMPMPVSNTDRWIWEECSPINILFDEEARVFDFWSFFARAEAVPFITSEQSHTSKAGSMSPIESLPSEVLSLNIKDPALDKNDIVALGFASPRLWSCTLNYIAKACWLIQAPLAGVEIACTGNYLTTLPESFTKDDYMKILPEPFMDDDFDMIFSEIDDDMCEARRFNYGAIEKYVAIKDPASEAIKWQASAKIHGHQLPESVLVTLSDELATACKNLSRSVSKNQPFVLRNLTTKQYVRCNSNGMVYHPKLKHLHLHDVMLLYICWSAPPCERSETSDQLKRVNMGMNQGQWAGHCFDIVPLEGQDLEDWTDYTSDVGEWALFVALCVHPTALANDKERSESSLKRKLDGIETGWDGIKKRDTGH